jgi:ribosome modulation factor
MRKTLIAVICIILLFFAYSCVKPNVEVVPDNPYPIEIVKMGVVKCNECDGDGLIDLEDKGEHCPKCDGHGILKVLSDGSFEQCNEFFARGYKDAKLGLKIEDCPYLIRFRIKEWVNGWELANGVYN